MAKKKFNISSTLKKNSKTEEVKLAPKIPLKKTTKDPEEVKTKVDEIHSGENKKAVEKTETIKETKATPKPKKAKPVEKGRMVRMTIDTPEEMHLQLKIKSIQTRMSMRDYVLRLIEKDLKKG
ncbi:MAG: hypothetical protein P8M17_00985 [Saprospiraceae bacterium]|jgi:hypothetical protein|nr:hypothetical protein [bacterium]MDG1433479.1 hypothetical protein [Saprospiraceae bacterium]MDG2417534.1 hypothetical protein [Saprospiraceae bacterium]